MYAQFRTQYPMGSLTSEVLQAQEGHYIVRAIVQVGNTTLATGLSAASSIEQAEDRARARALIVLGIELPTYEPQAHLMEVTESQSAPTARLSAHQLELPSALTAPSELAEWQAIEASSPVRPTLQSESSQTTVPWAELPFSRQDSAPSAPKPASAPLDLSDVITQTDVELKRLRWTTAKGRKYLEQVYSKRSRQHLTTPELLEFLQYLQSLPTPAQR
ncbi:hypothetical protein GS597_19450 [Synechococcales cyanobacterium C]|uniref:Uncharacterized protein n=1 Tax=Petrachloros mirabilis ULC683 TaxID=2781853 RepID=A0A8K2A2S9_9CYAN|nr:hypothetical protein [Petrachloros mirabilis]NCJ08642.1 hypothetical protein [Petrachloros mirabilis ULC683]